MVLRINQQLISTTSRRRKAGSISDFLPLCARQRLGLLQRLLARDHLRPDPSTGHVIPIKEYALAAVRKADLEAAGVGTAECLIILMLRMVALELIHHPFRMRNPAAGEAVILGDDGTYDFRALRSPSREAVLIAFDLIEHDGEDLRDLPPIERKRRPQRADLKGSGAKVFAHVCRLGLEGIVSKRTDAPYRSGPSKTWVMSKNPPAKRCGGSEKRNGGSLPAANSSPSRLRLCENSHAELARRISISILSLWNPIAPDGCCWQGAIEKTILRVPGSDAFSHSLVSIRTPDSIVATEVQPASHRVAD
jgi:hypothetical protein